MAGRAAARRLLCQRTVTKKPSNFMQSDACASVVIIYNILYIITTEERGDIIERKKGTICKLSVGWPRSDPACADTR